MRACSTRSIPNNHGSLAPIKVEAPEGSIVNAVRPQPCTARHVVGMFLPNALLKALAQIAPDAGDGRGLGRGVDDAGERHPRRRQPVHHGDVHLRRRCRGAGRQARAVDACSYPTGVAAVPIEVVEASAPIRFLRKALRPGSGGRGMQTGGLGQTIEFTVDTARPWQLNAVAVPPGARAGGHLRRRDRRGRSFTVNGEPVRTQARVTLQPDDVVRLELPGGGGYGRAATVTTSRPRVA